jgi:hypothetical protein
MRIGGEAPGRRCKTNLSEKLIRAREIQHGKPQLAVEAPPPDPAEAPPNLGEHGRALWVQVQTEFRIDDAGGRTVLLQACHALDMADRLAKQVAADETIETKTGFLAARHELACRAFAVRCLRELGITVEPMKLHGKPYKSYA